MTEHSMGRRPGDPFAITPDPAVYVPRAATEEARKRLLRSARNPAKTTVLIGPPGLGKTLLLQLLAEEVAREMQTAYLPYAALPPAELCDWALRVLDSPASDEPVEALRALAHELDERGSALLLAIDDAGAMPIATARWLGEFVERAGGQLRLALAATDNPSGNRVIAAIGCNFDIVHLTEPMTEGETRKYIDGRLALARAPGSIRARFDERIVRLLHRVSAGIPRRLHSAAAEILREAPAAIEGDEAVEAAPAAEREAPRHAPKAAPAAPVESETTLGVPREERRVAPRRAQPEGVAVRVGADGATAVRGRRAEDRMEAPPEAGEPDSQDSAEAAARGSEDAAAGAPDEAAAADAPGSRAEEGLARDRDEPAAADDRPGAEWEPASAAEAARRAPAPSRRAIALGALFVAFAAVAIPVIRAILSEPQPVASVQPAPEPRGPSPGDPPTRASATPGEPAQSAPADLRDSAAGIAGADLEPAPASAGNRPGSTAVGSREVPPAAGEAAPQAPVGPLAVQINATPWANVEVDGIDLGATPLANVPLFAGEHAFRVRMPDGRVIERTITIDAERRFLSFE